MPIATWEEFEIFLKRNFEKVAIPLPGCRGKPAGLPHLFGNFFSEKQYKLQFPHRFGIVHGVPHTALRSERGVAMKRCGWIFILLVTLASAPALEVQQARWGFDGTVVPGRFNLLSVLLENPSTDPFDGSVNLYKVRGVEQRLGALYGNPCYVSPLTARWVQFYVYVENQYDEWRVEWGRGADNRHNLDPPKFGPPGQVTLSSSDSALETGSSFRQFPEELFPPTAAATSGLNSLLLDHAPRWELPKRQAFLDWLRAGGTVHVLMGADGRYPTFSDELAALNIPQDRARIGAGLVIRHNATVQQIHKQDVADNDIPLRQYKANGEPVDYQTTETFLRTLSQLSHPNHNWALIYLLAFAYLGLAGPGNLLIGKRFRDYRLRIVLLLATVAAFTGLFSLVGRRGQGEASVVHTLSYAHAIDGDHYNVMQWINVFATHGAHYTITHAAPHNLYATGQDYESVNGMIMSGKDGRFIVDVPMFSRRAVLHEAEMKGPDLSVKIVNWDGAKTLNKLTLTVQPEFTKQILKGWVVQGDQVYPVEITDGRLEFKSSGSQSLSWLVSQNESQPAYYGNPYDRNGNINVEDEFRKLAAPLMNWSLGTRDFTNAPVPVPSGRVDLFLFARSPEGFGISGRQFGREVGYVLYHFDLFKPES
jgi:hypothetical protein